jgi:hypothetical protein
MSSRISKHLLFTGISFFVILFFSLVMPSYVNGQDLTGGTCSVPYSDGQYGIFMNYPSHFFNTGADTTLQPPAWIASFSYQDGQGTAFLNRYDSLGDLDLDTDVRIETSNRVHPDNVVVDIPRNAFLADLPAKQFEYVYTNPNDGQVWVSYTALTVKGGEVYEYTFLAPREKFDFFINDITCMTNSLRIR